MIVKSPNSNRQRVGLQNKRPDFTTRVKTSWTKNILKNIYHQSVLLAKTLEVKKILIKGFLNCLSNSNSSCKCCEWASSAELFEVQLVFVAIVLRCLTASYIMVRRSILRLHYDRSSRDFLTDCACGAVGVWFTPKLQREQ